MIVNFWKNNLSIFIDEDGFFNVLTGGEGIKTSDLTSRAHKSVYNLARKVLNCFPGLSALAFLISVDDPFSDIGDQYSIETLYSTAGFHYSFTAVNPQSQLEKPVIELILQHLLKRYPQ